MTFSTSLSFGGFLQGLQADLMSLIGSLICICLLWFIVRWVVRTSVADASKTETAQALQALQSVNKVMKFIILLTVLGFGVHAATFATNAIPHTDLDKSSVYDQMNSNIKK
jgi:hypothetical protein